MCFDKVSNSLVILCRELPNVYKRLTNLTRHMIVDCWKNKILIKIQRTYIIRSIRNWIKEQKKDKLPQTKWHSQKHLIKLFSPKIKTLAFKNLLQITTIIINNNKKTIIRQWFFLSQKYFFSYISYNAIDYKSLHVPIPETHNHMESVFKRFWNIYI